MNTHNFVVYLAVGRVDLRGAVDRLSAIVAQVLKMDPSCGALFLKDCRTSTRLVSRCLLSSRRSS